MEISLKDIFALLIRKIWVIIILAVVGGMASFVYVKLQKPTYTVKMEAYVKLTGVYTGDDEFTSDRRMDTLRNDIALLTSEAFFDDVMDAVDESALENEYDWKGFIKNNFNCYQNGSAYIIVFEVTSTSQVDAFNIAKAVESEANTYLISISPESKTFTLNFYKDAQPVDKPNDGAKTSKVLYGVLGGGVIGMLLVFGFSLIWRRVQSDEDVMSVFKLPVLASIDSLDDK